MRISVLTEYKIKEFVDAGEADIKTGPFGTQLKAAEYVESGTPVINVRNVGFGDIREAKLEYINEGTTKRLSSHLLEENDIVFGRKGAVERHAVIKKEQSGWLQGSDCIRLRVNSKKVLPQYLSYCFLTEDHKLWMMAHCSHGATMASLNQDIISRISVKLPAIDVQKDIIGVLKTYDNLIKNNNRRIAILEEMAQSLYREWFVKFRFSGHENIKFIDSPLGKIPEGWDVRAINSFVDIKSGFAFKSKTFVSGGEYQLITIKNVKDGQFIPASDSRIDDLPPKLPDYCHLKTGDLLLSLTGNVGRACLVYGENYLLNQRVAKLIAKDFVSDAYIYFMFRQPEFQKRLEMISTGVAQQNLSPVNMGELEVIYPAKEQLNNYAEITIPIINQMLTLWKKNDNLKSQRDMLLPKLISESISI